MSGPKTINCDCPRCGRAIAAAILAEGSKRSHPEVSITAIDLFANCPACEREFLIEQIIDYQDCYDRDDEPNIDRVCHPKSKAGTCPEHVPYAVETAFQEACGCLGYGFNNAAGATYRRTFEAITRDEKIVAKLDQRNAKDFSTLALKARLGRMKGSGIIPPSLYDVVDTLKFEGDTASHEPIEYSENDAKELKVFTEFLLETLYTVPHRLQAIKNRRAREK